MTTTKRAAKTITARFGVDSGTIGVVAGHRAIATDPQTTIDIDPGEYDVLVRVGKHTASARMKFPSGTAIVGDPCYADYPEGWEGVCKETDTLEKGGDWLLACSTGGDGYHRARIQFFKVPKPSLCIKDILDWERERARKEDAARDAKRRLEAAAPKMLQALKDIVSKTNAESYAHRVATEAIAEAVEVR